MDVIERLSHPERLTVRVHEELPREPDHPHSPRTRPVDREYVPAEQLRGAVAALRKIADFRAAKPEDYLTMRAIAQRAVARIDAGGR